jgi:hypothetical protein
MGFSENVEDVCDGCGGDVAVDLTAIDELKEATRVIGKWFTFQQQIQNDIGINQDLHYWYF